MRGLVIIGSQSTDAFSSHLKVLSEHESTPALTLSSKTFHCKHSYPILPTEICASLQMAAIPRETATMLQQGKVEQI